MPPAESSSEPNAAYCRFIDRARATVAIAAGVCVFLFFFFVGASAVNDSALVFVVGFLTCLAATAALVVEYLARPSAPAPFTLRSVLFRAVLILIGLSIVCFWMATSYGLGQATGGALGLILVLAAVHERRSARIVLAVFAAIVLIPTLTSTQSAYQYARRHADEIVAAGCELLDQCDAGPDNEQIDVADPRVPAALGKLGADKIVVNANRVAVYVPGAGSGEFCMPGFARAEFQVHRSPDNKFEGQWIERHSNKSRGAQRISDQLWIIEDD
jgi:hypothetical protein